MRKLTLIVVILISIAYSNVVFAENSANVNLISRMYNLWETTQDIIIHDNHAFIGTKRTGVQVVDISAPDNLEKVGYGYSDGGFGGFDIQDSLLYLAYLDKFTILDVSDPENFLETGSYEAEQGDYQEAPYLFDILVQDGYAYISSITHYTYSIPSFLLIVLDVSDPSNIQECSSIEYSTVHGLIFDEVGRKQLSNGVIYFPYWEYDPAGYRGGGIIAIDVSDPENPERIDTPDNFYDDIYIYSMCIRENYAYCTGKASGDLWVLTFDISDPAIIDSVSFLQFQAVNNWSIFQGSKVRTVEDRLIVCAQDSIFQLSLENPEQPEFLTRSGLDSTIVAHFQIEDELAFITGDQTIYSYDISDPENAELTDNLEEINGIISCLTIDEDIAYLVDNHHGLITVNISDPYNPEELGRTELFYGAFEDVAKAGDHLYIISNSGAENDFHVVNAAAPENPVLVNSLSENRGMGLYIFDNYVFISSVNFGLTVYDITNPETPERILADFEVGYRGIFPSTEGDNIFLLRDYTVEWQGINQQQLDVVSIEDPENPILVSSIELEHGVDGVCVLNYAYVVASDSLHIIDKSDLENLDIVNSFKLASRARRISVSGDFAYIACVDGGLRVIDISDPLNIHRVGYYDTPGLANDLFVDNGLGYLADFSNFSIYDCAPAWSAGEQKNFQPTSFEISSIYPNPFNSSVRLQYLLPFNADISIQVFNLNGRLISSLLNTSQQPGEYSLLWNTENISSGTYFINMIIPGMINETRKVVLVK